MITLVRVTTSDSGTFGVLLNDTTPIAVTCELPWKNNQHKISCIPAGTYQCVKWNSPSKGQVWKLQSVPDRDDILIHVANTIHDLLGCIGVGQGFFTYEGLPAISNSKATMELLKSSLPDTFTLTIRDAANSLDNA